MGPPPKSAAPKRFDFGQIIGSLILDRIMPSPNPEGGDVLIRNVLVAAIRIQSTPNLARWLGRLCRSCPYQIGKDQTHIWEFVASMVCEWGGWGSVAGVHAWAWGVHVARGSRDGGVTRGQEALAAAIRIRSAPNLARWLRRLGPGHHPSLGAIVSIFGNLWRRRYVCGEGTVGTCRARHGAVLIDFGHHRSRAEKFKFKRL